ADPPQAFPLSGAQWRAGKSSVSRQFHPSDLRVFALLRPPRSGVSRLASGQRRTPSHRSAAHTHSNLDCEGRESTRPAVQPPVSGLPLVDIEGDPNVSLTTGTQAPAR